MRRSYFLVPVSFWVIFVGLVYLANRGHSASESNHVASAHIEPLRGSEVRGVLVFSEKDGGVLIEGKLTGFVPNSLHGIHVHEKGNCSLPDGSSAGAHFNPAHKSHGGVDDANSHVGDFANIVADDNGVAEVKIQKKYAVLEKGKTSIMGRAIVVHAKKDDLHSQPAGNSGDRIACGVIAWDKPQPADKPQAAKE